MSIKYAEELAHRFYYDTEPGLSVTKSNVSFKILARGIKLFYSYKTLIGVGLPITNKKTKNTETLYIVTTTRYSATTTNHQAELMRAAPFSVTLIKLPSLISAKDCLERAQWGDEEAVTKTLENTRDVLVGSLVHVLDDLPLTEKKNREDFLALYESLAQLSKYVKVQAPILRKYRNVVKELTEHCKAYAAKQKKKLEAKRKAADNAYLREFKFHFKDAIAVMKKWLNVFPESVVYKVLSDCPISEGLDNDIKAEVYDKTSYAHMNDVFYRLICGQRPHNRHKVLDYAVVATDPTAEFEDNKAWVRTSRYATLSLKHARVAMTTYKAGKLKEGMHIGPYTVGKITNTSIEIGCHTFSAKTVKELGWIINLSPEEIQNYYDDVCQRMVNIRNFYCQKKCKAK